MSENRYSHIAICENCGYGFITSKSCLDGIRCPNCMKCAGYIIYDIERTIDERV